MAAKATTTVYYVDGRLDHPEPVECDTVGYPNRDVLGRTMYKNSHFQNEQGAWEWLIRNVEAKASSIASKIIDARLRLIALNEDASDGIVRIKKILDGKATWEGDLGGQPMRLPGNTLVTVCSKCLRASCWHGEFMCSESRRAGTVERTVDELDAMNLEHPSNYSAEKIRSVCEGLSNENPLP